MSSPTVQTRSEVSKPDKISKPDRDRSRSDRIVQRFRQSAFKSERKRVVFSGTWQATVEEVFPLLCPAREADWIPGWDCDLVYTESGYAEENCVFRTNKSNSVGDGLWVFTGFQVNQYVEFVRKQDDLLTRAHITVDDNGDGTVTGTWNVLYTGLTERGNAEIAQMPEEKPPQAAPLIRMIDYYLEKGKTINRAQLAMDMVAGHVKGHLS